MKMLFFGVSCRNIKTFRKNLNEKLKLNFRIDNELCLYQILDKNLMMGKGYRTIFAKILHLF